MDVDYLIIGSGLTGAVIARQLRDAGKDVLVLERRSHPGGNIADDRHFSGIEFHRYGPHYFRTSSEQIWSFMQRFARFRSFEAHVQTLFNGSYYTWPLQRSEHTAAFDSWPGMRSDLAVTNFETACLARVPQSLYEAFICEYTEKQWARKPSELAPALANRIEVRESFDPRLVQHRYQGLPEGGYRKLIEGMLEGIPVLLNVDYYRNRTSFCGRVNTIVTGSIDEFFDFTFGRLAYRAQHREYEYFPHAGCLLPAAQVNNPQHAQGSHIRTIEWKQLMDPESRSRTAGTLLSRETPLDARHPDEYEYPIPDSANNALYQSYRQLACKDSKVIFCGRLGEYRYLDMDQAVARALIHAKRLLKQGGADQSDDELSAESASQV